MMPSIPQLLIILAIVVLIFGAKRLRNLGSDLGAAVKGFKTAVKDEKNPEDPAKLDDKAERVAENDVTTSGKEKIQ
ncbi:MAG TPA: twin-arginine translocase TatA/TatE family subunit [Gammaproteobacteria bacterium]|jgi:sec-independent protein translocase protein TatA|nr:twin-arginine translocase TatA/TatE family subunit [Gammaproteobacteria bacterium]